MTRVCLVGNEGLTLQYELLSRETARDALATYDLAEPFANTVGVETVSLGAAVSLLNDLDWYLARFVAEAMVLEPSVSESEWLSRDLAMAVRDDEMTPAESERFLKIYGLEPVEDGTADPPDGGSTAEHGPPDGTDDGSPEAADRDRGGSTAGGSDPADRPTTAPGYRLVEPMYVTRTGGDLPAYDLRDVEETLVERVTEDEFGA